MLKRLKDITATVRNDSLNATVKKEFKWHGVKIDRVYKILKITEVYRNQTTVGDGLTVFQRKVDGRVYFS